MKNCDEMDVKKNFVRVFMVLWEPGQMCILLVLRVNDLVSEQRKEKKLGLYALIYGKAIISFMTNI